MSNAGIYVDVKGVAGIHRALRPLLQPEIDQHIWSSLKKGAAAYAKDLRRESKPASKTMAGAVRYYKARRERPAYVVGYRRKRAFFTHFVIGGTRDHGPRRARALVFIPGFNPYLGASSHGVGNGWVRAARVRGVPANPIVERVATRGESARARDIETQFVKETGL
jgi:hypothetical protein